MDCGYIGVGRGKGSSLTGTDPIGVESGMRSRLRSQCGWMGTVGWERLERLQIQQTVS